MDRSVIDISVILARGELMYISGDISPLLDLFDRSLKNYVY